MRAILNQKEQEITALENEKAILEERIEQFISGEVSTFKDGKYSSEVKEVYQGLMCMGVGAKNVESIVRKVLGKIGGITADRLPKETFAKYMYLEARGLAQIQMAEKLLDGCEGHCIVMGHQSLDIHMGRLISGLDQDRREFLV